MDKLEILLATYSLPISIVNPWGDFNRILAITTRLKPAHPDMIGVVPSIRYFKVDSHNGSLQPMTIEEFKDACVAAIVQGVPPFHAELP